VRASRRSGRDLQVEGRRGKQRTNPGFPRSAATTASNAWPERAPRARRERRISRLEQRFDSTMNGS